ncbi:MAG: acetyl-CoA decarbonylase/synthase complex subunit gamma [Candidatus Bathyarchaeia archaeon]
MPRPKLSPIDIYRELPKTNCKECGVDNCMAFATRLVNREMTLDQCPPLLKPESKEVYQKLWELLRPPVREVTVGVGERSVKIGGKQVMYRHELTYVNPTAIAIDVSDELAEDELEKRVKAVENFTYGYIGQSLRLDMVAVRSTTGDAKRFGAVVRKVAEITNLPLMLCSLNPDVVEEGLAAVGKSRPLIYAATKDNWKDMADLAKMYSCPLVVAAPNDIALLKSLTRTLNECGVEDLVLDPGTFPEEGLADTINNFTMLRRLACKEEDELVGYPLLGAPISAWVGYEGPAEVASWNEAVLATMLITRYADILVMHTTEGWSLLPTVILRQNIYTDPRKPVSVEAGLRVFGAPDAKSPLLLTSNFALTYFTVASDIETGKVSCYLLVVDTEGLSVESAVAGRKLTAEKVGEALKAFRVEEKITHRKLIIPGRAARLSGEIEETTGWQTIVGPMDSSGIPGFIAEKWPKLVE